MKRILPMLWLTGLLSLPAMATDGMIHVPSSFDVAESADRLERIIEEKGMTLFNRIKHAEAAAEVGVELRDVQLIIFGNPKVGSPLIKCQPSVAIDLPQKALIWKDELSRVWISYNDPGYLKVRHNISGCDEVLDKIANALSAISKAAAGQ